MYQRRRVRVLLATLVLTALVLITVDFRSSGGPLDALRAGATAVFEPVQNGLSTVLRPVGDAFASVRELFRLRDENAELRARLEELATRNQSFTDLRRQNEELRGLLGIQEQLGFEETVVARVVALAPSNYEWTVTLDAGRADGIDRNMVVVNRSGLVGRVVQVTEHASRVLLAIDPNFSASVRTAADGEVGSIDGRGGDLMVFRPIDPEGPIEVGDEVVTNRYDYGIFPSGIPVGAVESVGDATSLLEREVLVRPFVDFTGLDFVMVVLQLPVEEPPPIPDRPEGPFIPPNLIPSPSPDPSPDGASPSPSPGAAPGDDAPGGGA